MAIQPGLDIIFLDTETTGTENGRLVQLAYKKRGDVRAFVEYYKPSVPIEIGAMTVHHITEKQVAGKPVFQGSDVHAALSRSLADAILVAHNAKFDIGILKTEGVETHQHICTLKVAQALYDIPSYKLQYLRYLWGIDVDEVDAHDAEGDVIILEKVFEHMRDGYASAHRLSEQETISAFVEISNNPLLLRRIAFGKHVGETFEEIKANDPDYLLWLSSLSDKDEDFLYTVNYYLKDRK